MDGLDIDTSSPEALAKAFEQLSAGEDPVAQPADVVASPEQSVKQDVEKPQTQTQQANQPEPEGIATKDGKHIIPYTVLQSERARATKAEQMAQEMRDRVAALEAQVQASQGAKQGESARTTQQTSDVSDLPQEDLEALKEDFPTVYKAVMASMAAAKALEAKLQPVEETVRNAQADQARSAQETVQEAIDSVPKLAHLQATNAEAFEMAKQFDGMLRNQPMWADKPLSERFARVAELVEGAIGPIQIPNSQSKTGDLKAAAQAKAQQAAKATRTEVPTSLSEFPVGQHAAQDEREAAENMTALQLAERFSRMTPDQMDAYFQDL